MLKVYTDDSLFNKGDFIFDVECAIAVYGYNSRMIYVSEDKELATIAKGF